ncbi:hypothetical protein FA15DRAFT_757816 [Coprinopsis marcescibilis]|uniref:F-box domain-containing protein n=1 Tax=Coprinopsis marcescibilis TaxID=230819 RepID=A0A5C3KQG1_COPMA|nr:hypothetical protein FA15DRAFT_757816 [Coprinopsis marcescibilis]
MSEVTATSMTDLPLELLIKILRQATLPESGLDPTSEGEGLYYTSTRKFALPNSWEYKHNMATKRTLVRVCKLWNSVATPYLQEHLQITRPQQLELIHARIAGSSDHPNLFTKLTRRLDFSLNERYHMSPFITADTTRQVYWKLEDILSGLPNLLTLILVRSSEFSGSSMMGKRGTCLLNAASCNLEHLYWIEDSAPWSTVVEDRHAWLYFMSGHRKLRSARCPFPDRVWPGDAPHGLNAFTTGCMLEEIALPNSSMSVLYADLLSSSPSRHSLNNLVYLKNTFSSQAGQSNSVWDPFLSAHGRRVVSLHIAFPWPKVISYVTSTAVCPNLQTLVIHQATNLGFSSIAQVRHPILETICIKISQPQISNKGISFITSNVLRAKHGLPALKTLQFLDEKAVKHFRVHLPKKLNQMVVGLDAIGVAVKDARGGRVCTVDFPSKPKSFRGVPDEN